MIISFLDQDISISMNILPTFYVLFMFSFFFYLYTLHVVNADRSDQRNINNPVFL